VCGREHTTNDQPVTCPTCEGKIRDDLETIPHANTALAIEALDGGSGGRLVAAAPIPGGTAQVLIGPSVRLDLLRTGSLIGVKTLAEDHHRKDPIPPLAVLAQWDSIWRRYLDHRGPVGGRPTVSGCCAYLTTQLGYMAQQSGPGSPTSGSSPTRCAASAPASSTRCTTSGNPSAAWSASSAATSWSAGSATTAAAGTTPRHATSCGPGSLAARVPRTSCECSHLPRGRRTTARRAQGRGPAGVAPRRCAPPCERCAASPGGIDNPDPGQSWECPGCRKEYSVGEYANAVRRDLLENGVDGDGWTHIGMAAEAATTMTGYMIPAGTVRKWCDRGKVASKLSSTGVRLVYWPDVADEATAAVARHLAAAEERRRKAELEAKLWTRSRPGRSRASRGSGSGSARPGSWRCASSGPTRAGSTTAAPPTSAGQWQGEAMTDPSIRELLEQELDEDELLARQAIEKVATGDEGAHLEIEPEWIIARAETTRQILGLLDQIVELLAAPYLLPENDPDPAGGTSAAADAPVVDRAS
jgi:hypothetical protein